MPMTRIRSGNRCCWAAACVIVPVTFAESDPPAPLIAPQTEPTQAVTPPPPGPKYHNLRWKEDFSYLAGPEGSYIEDWADPIKHFEFGERWSLGFGGSFRARLESRTNNLINLPDPTQDTTLLHRYFLHADLRYGGLARLFIEGIFAAIEDNDSLPVLPTNENRGDFHQFFIDLRVLGEDTPLTLRVGRQELQYGRQRLISPLDWANARRRFDGVKLFWESETWDADAFYVFTLPDVAAGFRSRLDTYDERQYLMGAYTTYKGIPRHGVDLYYLYYRNANQPINADGKIGSLNLNTLGGRFWGETGSWDYDTELSGQFGGFAGDSVQAWAWAADGGYTFREAAWSPRVGVGLDYAGGDRNPDDGRHQRFHQLFPLGHAYLGYIDLVGRQNVRAVNVNLRARPTADVTTEAAYHVFWLDRRSDGLFNAGGALQRRDITGGSSREIGQELDIRLRWNLDVHSSLLLGYSHFWTGRFIDRSGRGDDAHFLYLQFELKF